jgi:hypothetical protein
MVFAHAAEGADPVGREVFPFGAGGYAIVGVSGGRVIDIAAYITYILVHLLLFLGG